MRNKLFANKTLLATATLVAIGGSLASGSVLAAPDLGAKLAQVPAAAQTGRVEAVKRFVVTYRDGSTARTNNSEALRSFTKAMTGSGLSAARLGASPRVVRNTALGGTVIAMHSAIDRVQAATLLRQLASDPNVASVEIDEKWTHTGVRAPKSATPSYIPNDPRFGTLQWHLQAPDGALTPTLQQANRGGANLPNAWDLADGSGIVVAVIDTGITMHSDLDTSLAAAGYDFISDAQTSGRPTDDRVPGGWDLGDWTTEEPWLSECTDANNPPEDSSWHGTHVSGTVGAQLTGNALAGAGIAHGAKVLPIRALGHCGGYNADINDAIVWAAGGSVPGMPVNPNPAKVINLSLGGGGSCSASSSAGQAVAAANALGAVVVVAAGNHNGDASTRSPASCPGVITVGATGVTGKRAYYSGYGTTVEIAAPGGGVYVNDATSTGSVANPDGFVWQATNGGLTVPTTEYLIGGMAGTSMASPHVAGVVALMQGARLDAGKPLLTPTEVVTLLQQTVTSFPSTPDRAIGPGILNAHAAVLAAIAHGDDNPGEPGDPGAPTAIELVNKVAVNGVSGGEKLYSFQAAAGSKLTILTYGGSGDVSLYVKQGSEPSATSNDAFSARAGNSETVTITAPTAGTYYIKLTGSYSGLSLVARQ